MQSQVSLQEEERGSLDTDQRGEDNATVKAETAAVMQVQAKDTSNHRLEEEGNRPCPRASGGNTALHHLDSGPAMLALDDCPPELGEKTFLLLRATRFVVISYSGHKN